MTDPDLIAVTMAPVAARTLLVALNHTIARFPGWEDMEPSQRHSYEWLTWLENRVYKGLGEERHV